MSASRWSCLVVVLLLLLSDVTFSWYEETYIPRRGYPYLGRRLISYPRDWDIDWVASQRRAQAMLGANTLQEETSHQLDKSDGGLQPRMIVLPKDNSGVGHSPQQDSPIILTEAGDENKVYRGTIITRVFNGTSPRRRNNRNHRQRARDNLHQRQRNMNQEPAYIHRTHPKDPKMSRGRKKPGKVCARCPSDRKLLAKKGATSAIMEVPPIVPCHPWSSVQKVKQEILVGPQPGEEILEGSHKIVIRLYRRRRTIINCVTRYNVIVRKCSELEVGPGVQVDCGESGRVWGARCNMTCDPGYDLEGDSFTECTDDLEWSGQMPQCLASPTSCPAPVAPDHGHISCRSPQHQPARARGMLPDGSLCRYRCEAGYSIPPTQQHLTKVRCVGGSWDSDQDPTCVEDNEIEEEETPTEISAADALRFDGKGCPEGFCQNKGKCIMILNVPMCSCLPGYSGLNCEEKRSDKISETEESNSIT